MNNSNKEDLEKLSKLLDEYTDHLREIIILYREKQKKFLFLIVLLIFLINFILILFMVLEISQSFAYTMQILSNLIMVFIAALILLFTTSFLSSNQSSMSWYGIIDDIELICSKLKKILKITSQYREHLTQYDEVSKLYIDLKLTEAENMLMKAEILLKTSNRSILHKILKNYINLFSRFIN